MRFSRHLARVWLALERARSGLRADAARVEGLSVPYLYGGEGPPLLLIHGFGGDGYNFARVATYLRRYFYLLIPDLPGFGEADKPSDVAYDVRSQARRLGLFLEGLGINSAHVGGNSMGGFIAAKLAQQRPELVRSLWMLDALGCPSARNSEMFENYRHTGRLPLIIRTPRDFERCLKLVSERPFWIPRSLKRHFAARAMACADLHERIADVLGNTLDDLVPGHDRIDVPTLIVWGREDRVLSPQCIPEQRAIFPRNTVIEMPQTGHLPMVEQPRETAADYLRFIGSVESGPLGTPSASTRSTNR